MACGLYKTRSPFLIQVYWSAFKLIYHSKIDLYSFKSIKISLLNGLLDELMNIHVNKKVRA